MPPISMPGANRAELNVNSNTSLQDLVKFQSKAAEKGYGEIRARQNKDGSVTLYMPAARKISLKDVFGDSWGKDARTQKRDLATATVKDILRKHLEASLPDKGVGSVPARTWTNALLARLDQPIRNSHLGDALTETASLHQSVLQAAHDDAEKISPAIAGHFKNIDVILSEPALAPKLGAFMFKQSTTENFTFLTGLEGYGKVQEPAEKMRLAEALFKMIESPENPPMSIGSITKLGDTHKQMQVNISSDAAKLIIKDIQNLRTQMAAGGITSREDKSVLDKLFQAAGKEITKLSAADLKNFVETPEFKAGVGEILISRPLYKDVPAFTSLENVLANPGMREAFTTHLATDSKLAAAFDRFNQIESLAAMPASPDTQANLIAQTDLLLNGPAPAAAAEAAPAGPAADEVASLDSDDAVAPATRDPVTESFSRRLDVIKQMAQGSTISLPKDQGGIEYSFVLPVGEREAAGLKSLLKDMGGDAANSLRGDALQSFIGSPLMQAVLAERNPQPGAEKNHGSFEPFAGGPTAKVGGQSGSVQTEVKGQKYQLKFDIANSSWTRRTKAGGLNTENDSEMISANILRGMRGETTKAMLPEVGLRQNSANNQTVVTSKYLQGNARNLDQYYEQEVGRLPFKLIGNSHVKVAVNSSEKNGNGVLHLSGQASQDVLNNLVERALIADHDVNVGNGMVMEGKLNAVEGKRIGQIDFGHAFNDLINGFGGKATGGGVRFEKNRILDFFNRETVSGNPFKPGAQDSKLWRDYTGVGPSAGMTEALRSLANNPKSLDGLVQAKAAYVGLIADLEDENTPAAAAQLKSQLASLAKISANVGHTILANTAPGDVVQKAFQGLSDFITTGQQEMREVADLSALQTRIESFVANQDPASQIPADIRAEFNEIAPTLRTVDGTGLTWMKLEKAVPGFVGSLDSYVASRRAQLFPADHRANNPASVRNIEVVTAAESSRLPPLPALTEGPLSRLRSETPERRVNEVVKAHNLLRSTVDMTQVVGIEKLLASAVSVGMAIRLEKENNSEFGNKLEVVAFVNRLKSDVALLTAAKGTAVAAPAPTSTSQVGLLSAVKPVDTSPTRWVKQLDDSSIDLTDLQSSGDAKKGAQGATFHYVTRDDRQLVGKVDRNNADAKESVAREFENYQAIYAAAGRHPNLGNVHGWADLRLGKQHAEGMLMDLVPGPDGLKFQKDLKAAWDDGVITTEQYWGAVQHVTRVLLEVVEHLGKADFVHNDLKPENYVIDATTGQPIVIDLGGASLKGEYARATTPEFAAPEMLSKEGKAILAAGAEAGDVFTVGSTLQHMVESPFVNKQRLLPNQPVRSVARAFTQDSVGNAMKRPYQTGASLEYTKFVGQTMSFDPTERPSADFAGNMGFVQDSLLDAESALDVLKGVASGKFREEWQGRWLAANKSVPDPSPERHTADTITNTMQKAHGPLDTLRKDIVFRNSEGRLEADDLKNLQTATDNLSDWVQRAKHLNTQGETIDVSRYEKLINISNKTVEQLRPKP